MSSAQTGSSALLGCTVLVFADPQYNNGSDVAPAIITRVWNDRLVNVRIMYDGPIAAPEYRIDWMTSVPLYGSEAEARAAHAEKWAQADHDVQPFGAFWPGNFHATAELLGAPPVYLGLDDATVRFRIGDGIEGRASFAVTPGGQGGSGNCRCHGHELDPVSMPDFVQVGDDGDGEIVPADVLDPS